MISIHIANDCIFVRFVKVENKSQFDRLLDSFKREFSNAEWNWMHHAWQLPIDTAPHLSWFVYRYFGYNAIVYDSNAQLQNTSGSRV